MKDRTIFTVVAMMLCLGLSYSSAAGQGFAKILEKLDQLENRMNDLENDQDTNLGTKVEKLEATQKRELKALQNQLATLPTRTNVDQLSQSLTDLNSRVDQFATDLGTVTTASGSSPDAEIAGALTGELRDLIGSLRQTIAATTTQTPEPSLPLEITGFGDFLYVGSEEQFETGQVEVDLETTLDDRIGLSAAIAFGGESFELGAFTIDFHLFGSEGDHFRPATAVAHSGVIIGQFDVPFGLDWLVYPSIDRKLVSGPVVIENSHDFWNDYGVQGYLETEYVNAVAYAVNGFGYEGGEEEIEMKIAGGGRVGIKPHALLEIGGSYAGFFDEGNELDMSLVGVDGQFSIGNFSAKGEYVIHHLGQAGENEIEQTGFYGQGMYEFGRYFLVSRYGQYRPEGEEKLTRLSVGGGWVVQEGCEVRMEQQINSEEENVTLLQLVIGF